MPNTSLIQSNWSNSASIQCGFLLNNKPKKTFLKSFESSNPNGLIEDNFLIEIEGSLYCLFNDNEFFSISKYAGVANTWNTIAISSVAYENDYLCVGFNNKIYILFGDAGSLTFKIYDITTNTWSDGIIDSALCLFNYYEVALTYYENNLYVFGKSSTASVPTDLPLFLKYDTTTTVWTAIDFTGKIVDDTCPGSFDFAYIGKAATGFYLYGLGATYSFWYYDYATNVWTKKNNAFGLPDINTTFFNLSLIVDKLFAIGSVFDVVTDKQRFIFKYYDTLADTWHQLSNIQGLEEYKNPSLCFKDNALYVLDYHTELINKPNIKNIEHDIVSDNTLLEARFAHAYNGSIYNMSPFYQADGKKVCMLSEVNLTTKVVTNSIIPDFNTFSVLDIVNIYSASIMIGTDIYFYGGRNAANVLLNTLIKFNVVTKTWTLESDAGIAIQNASMCQVGDNLYVIGGTASTDTSYFTTIQVYSLTNKTWSTITPNSIYITNRTSPRLLIKDNNIYIYHGNSYSLNSTERAKVIKFNTADSSVTIMQPLVTNPNGQTVTLFNYNGLSYAGFDSAYDGAPFTFYLWDSAADTYTLDKTFSLNSAISDRVDIDLFFDVNISGTPTLYLYGEMRPTSRVIGANVEGGVIKIDLNASSQEFVASSKLVPALIFTIDKPSVSYHYEKEQFFLYVTYRKTTNVSPQYVFYGILDREYNIYSDDEFSFSTKSFPLGFTHLTNDTYNFKVRMGTKKTGFSKESSIYELII